MTLKSVRQKGTQYYQLIRHFQNPDLVLFTRLGLIKIAYWPYQIRQGGVDYRMLGQARGGDLWVLREVLVEETYRPILRLLPRGPLRILDLGAHIGAFTIWLHRQHGVAEAFCFEPNPEFFTLLQFNLSQNGCENVRLYRQAMGGSTRQSEMWLDTVTHARSSLHRRSTSSFEHLLVQVIALNEWLEKVGGTFDLLKMDCEGAEWEMLKAAPTAFMRFSLVVAEVHEDPDGCKNNICEFAGTLSRHGFTTVHGDGLYIGRREVLA
jgi:FkbM family methyltransferase